VVITITRIPTAGRKLLSGKQIKQNLLNLGVFWHSKFQSFSLLCKREIELISFAKIAENYMEKRAKTIGKIFSEQTRRDRQLSREN
jgi:hypothetical protein